MFNISNTLTFRLVVGIFISFLIPAAVIADDTRMDFFEKKIRPVLVSHCYKCHSAESATKGKLKGGLALDTRKGMLKGGESGTSIIPGKPSESLLIKALKYSGLEMPPTEKLPPQVIADFEKWIGDGAFDPREGDILIKKQGLSIEEGKKFWSFIPPKKFELPKVRQNDWPSDPIDFFILSKMENQKLTPSPMAKGGTLVRRLYYDLTGLPPTEIETANFLKAFSENPAKAKLDLIDSLLSSHHFGEKWGRLWLDVARYADSNGKDRNIYNFHAWRYRDYVIDSFNRDIPFDQFVKEQIAGDLLPAHSREERDRNLIATGFLSLGSKSFEELKPEVFRMDVIDEQIELVSRSVLGLSVGCARCHNHKFDPIPTADYYSMAGIFRSTQPLYGYSPKGIKATAFAHTELQAIGPDAEKLGPAGLAYFAKLQELTLAQNISRSDRYRVVRNLSAARIDIKKPDANKSKLEIDVARMEQEVKDWDVKVKAHEAALQLAIDNPPNMPSWAMAVREREKAEDCKIHVRGETTNLKETVPRGTLQVISFTDNPSIPNNQSGRRELADWLTDPRNPLAARVYVNRVWQHLFGRGLVSTPDDYGVNGSRPSHPELLDHLALRFIDQGWSTKKLIRALVLSSTYLQDGADESQGNGKSIDPDNIYLSYMRPRRLQAEFLRDAIMQVAGTLDRVPLAPEKAFLAKYNPYREEEYRTFQPLFTPEQIENPHRSVYLPVVRGVLPEIFGLFDFASPDRSTSQREESIVPAQSLYFMNNEWVIKQAGLLSGQLLKDDKLDDKGRIKTIYRRAFSREPSSLEINRALDYLNQPELLLPDSKSKKQPDAMQLRNERLTSFCQIVFASAEFRFIK
jgi:hypothetical protein